MSNIKDLTEALADIAIDYYFHKEPYNIVSFVYVCKDFGNMNAYAIDESYFIDLLRENSIKSKFAQYTYFFEHNDLNILVCRKKDRDDLKEAVKVYPATLVFENAESLLKFAAKVKKPKPSPIYIPLNESDLLRL